MRECQKLQVFPELSLLLFCNNPNSPGTFSLWPSGELRAVRGPCASPRASPALSPRPRAPQSPSEPGRARASRPLPASIPPARPGPAVTMATLPSARASANRGAEAAAEGPPLARPANGRARAAGAVPAAASPRGRAMAVGGGSSSQGPERRPVGVGRPLPAASSQPREAKEAKAGRSYRRFICERTTRYSSRLPSGAARASCPLKKPLGTPLGTLPTSSSCC